MRPHLRRIIPPTELRVTYRDKTHVFNMLTEDRNSSTRSKRKMEVTVTRVTTQKMIKLNFIIYICSDVK